MDVEKRLEEKVRKYLNSREFPIVDNYVEYIVLCENYELPNGTIKNMHQLTFLAASDRGEEPQLCFIFADEATEKLELLRTPHISSYINEE